MTVWSHPLFMHVLDLLGVAVNGTADRETTSVYFYYYCFLQELHGGVQRQGQCNTIAEQQPLQTTANKHTQRQRRRTM